MEERAWGPTKGDGGALSLAVLDRVTRMAVEGQGTRRRV